MPAHAATGSPTDVRPRRATGRTTGGTTARLAGHSTARPVGHGTVGGGSVGGGSVGGGSGPARPGAALPGRPARATRDAVHAQEDLDALALLDCSLCGQRTPHDGVPCVDGHGADCPERVCRRCGAAALAGWWGQPASSATPSSVAPTPAA